MNFRYLTGQKEGGKNIKHSSSNWKSHHYGQINLYFMSCLQISLEKKIFLEKKKKKQQVKKQLEYNPQNSLISCHNKISTNIFKKLHPIIIHNYSSTVDY